MPRIENTAAVLEWELISTGPSQQDEEATNLGGLPRKEKRPEEKVGNRPDTWQRVYRSSVLTAI